MNKTRKSLITNILLVFVVLLNIQLINSQQVEVQGELKVSDMTANDTEENLVTRNTDGTLGTRSVSSLPPPPPPIDTTRNLASDFELVKHLCQCQNLPPFMIKKLIESGYTQEELMASGIPVKNVLDAQRGGILLDTRDNQTYKTVTIGAQTWMAENLNYGQRIDHPTTPLNDLNIEKFCYDNDISNCDTYGGLYYWDEMMQYVTSEGTQGVCPTGWHIPTDDEWKTLEMELGLTLIEADSEGDRGTDQGSKLSGNDGLWESGSLEEHSSFGSSGFDILPGGEIVGSFFNLSLKTSLWSSTEENGINAFYRSVQNDDLVISRYPTFKFNANYVRCIKD